MVVSCSRANASARPACEVVELGAGRAGRELGVDQVEEAPHQPALVQRELAPDQVERLDAVGALVDLADARVAGELLDAGLA